MFKGNAIVVNQSILLVVTHKIQRVQRQPSERKVVDDNFLNEIKNRVEKSNSREFVLPSKTREY